MNWDAASLEKFYRTKDGQILYRKMCAIDQALEELLCQGKFNDKNIDRAIESIVFAGIREGSIKHNGNTYSANTSKVWESFRLILERFYK